MAVISKELREMSLQSWFPIMMRELGYERTKHGRWMVKSKSIKDIPTEACSECGMWSYGDDMNYCPNCGAKMDEVEE